MKARHNLQNNITFISKSASLIKLYVGNLNVMPDIHIPAVNQNHIKPILPLFGLNFLSLCHFISQLPTQLHNVIYLFVCLSGVLFHTHGFMTQRTVANIMIGGHWAETRGYQVPAVPAGCFQTVPRTAGSTKLLCL